MKIEKIIQRKAYELGYEKCGIIPVSMMEGYSEKVKERIRKVPESEPFYQSLQLADPQLEYPWAKSVIVLAVPYGKYKIPEPVKGHIAKAYLFDVRVDSNTIEHQHRQVMEQYLNGLGLKVAAKTFGIVGLRWAALQAGIGIIRRNNFLYTESGSWVHLEAWLIDAEMELKENSEVPTCSVGCNRCMESCPTKSLSAPYTMSPTACISFLTTFGGRDLPKEPLSKQFGECIYGCDICQNVCPMNKHKCRETEEFPGLAEIAPMLTPEKIMEMQDDYYKEKIQPKFFYLSVNELWKWKINALCFMRNNYQEKYRPYIMDTCNNENVKIRELAQSIYNEIRLGQQEQLD